MFNIRDPQGRSNIIAAYIIAAGGIIAAVIGGLFALQARQGQQVALSTGTVLAQIGTQSKSTQTSLQDTIAAPTNTPLPTYTALPTYTLPPLPTAPPPSPTPLVTLPFTDNFDSGARPEWGEEKGTWLMSNGEYTITDIDIERDWNFGISTVGDLGWSNYLVKVVTNLREFLPCGSNRVAILVRVRDTKNFLAFKIHDGEGCIANTPIEYAAWYAVKDGEWVEVSNTRYTDYPHTKPFEVEIQVRDNIITTFVNSEQANSFSNLPFSTGKVGLLVESFKDGDRVQTATIDNFSVEAIPPP